MNVLILGDSWAADWSEQYSEYLGWPNIVAEQHTVTNIAQAGVSQYSILKQLDTVQPQDYDAVIISITSPYRVYTPQHPVHTSGLHTNSDLIYTDIEHHATENPDNKRLQSAKAYFEHHYDLGEDLYNLFLDKEHRQYSCAYFSHCLSPSSINASISFSLFLNSSLCQGL